ncbi:hypothetical protein GCM10009811_35450 [Nostocoides veronense]|uniref:Uncharacterized protein n=1 Tax=Nostocoides veronense TaxID=330836 RepID=A0ABP4YCU4_9MICO
MSVIVARDEDVPNDSPVGAPEGAEWVAAAALAVTRDAASVAAARILRIMWRLLRKGTVVLGGTHDAGCCEVGPHPENPRARARRTSLTLAFSLTWRAPLRLLNSFD